MIRRESERDQDMKSGKERHGWDMMSERMVESEKDIATDVRSER